MNGFAVDCIVPFYNEGTRVTDVVSGIIGSRMINRVICVDDGSTDTGATWPENSRIERIRHRTNLGKTQAVRTGLKHVRTPYVFLIDADLIGLTPSMLDACIRHVLTDRPDMLVLRRTGTLWSTRQLRLDLLVAGERIVRTDLLKHAVRPGITGYALEPALNRFLMRHSARIDAVALPFSQYRKSDKYGLLPGLVKDAASVWQVTRTFGIRELWRQISRFHTVEVTLPQADA